jgi:alpha-aminoadipic semialdehyde synthase
LCLSRTVLSSFYLNQLKILISFSAQSPSCITSTDGKLEPGYRYLQTLMNREPAIHAEASETMHIALEGHLFDSGLINQVLDVIERKEAGVGFDECNVPRPSRGQNKSSVLLRITANDTVTLDKIEKQVAILTEVIVKADAAMSRIDPNRPDPTIKSQQVVVRDGRREKRILVLGAGLVSKSAVELLGRSEDNCITVMSEKEEDAKNAASAAKNGRYTTLNISSNAWHWRLLEKIEDSDLVISLLPAPMHPLVATECIVHKVNLVTASYESEEMRNLRDRVIVAGIVILNEVGLDPGLDHMSAMRIIDDVKNRGGRVCSFSSVCGGLPAPEVADNPFKYKFSWSPQGVIRAAQNSARYRQNGRLVEVSGDDLLSSAAPFVSAWPELDLECLPNRNSLVYESIYGIENASTIFRGTLRYRGYSDLLNIFKTMGLLDASVEANEYYWESLLDHLRMRRGGFKSLQDFVRACADDDEQLAERTMEALEWLGMLGELPVLQKESVFNAFCHVLEHKLRFLKRERDMVVMHHIIEAVFEDGSAEKHTSSLKCFGDSDFTAMAKTVGYTTACAAQLVLNGSFRNESGLYLPTHRKVYEPVMEAVAKEGIVFDDHVTTIHPSEGSQA